MLLHGMSSSSNTLRGRQRNGLTICAPVASPAWILWPPGGEFGGYNEILTQRGVKS